MKDREIKELVNYVRNHTKKEQEEFVSNDEIVDFKDGSSFGWQEAEKYKEEYDKIKNEVDEYIEDNELDDMLDSNQIKNNFREYDNKDYFEISQACLIDFEDFVIKKIGE